MTLATNGPSRPAAAAAAAAAADAPLWLWRLTWGAGRPADRGGRRDYVFAMLAVPELRSAITPET